MSLGRRSRSDLPNERLASEAEALNAEMLEVFGDLDDREDPLSGSPGMRYKSTTSARHPTRTPKDPASPAPSSETSSITSPKTPSKTQTPIQSTSRNSPPRLTHADESGKAAMVDVGGKSNTTRTATASARVLLGPTAFSLVAANQIKKGDVLTVAQLAGIMGSKHTATLIPLCHPLLLSHVEVALELNPGHQAIDILATASTVGPTGVEMEAMTAAAVSALTVYDMCKAASKGIEITDLRLEKKTGGNSGTWVRPGSDYELMDD